MLQLPWYEKDLLAKAPLPTFNPQFKKVRFFIGNSKGTFWRGYFKDMGSVKFTCQAMQSQRQDSKNIKK